MSPPPLQWPAFVAPPPVPDGLRLAVARSYRTDEAAPVRALVEHATLAPDAQARAMEAARALAVEARAHRGEMGGLDAFLHEYALSTREGVVLMCLAEALLRIPDDDTADALIRDKIAGADWAAHLGRSESVFVNASTWGLMLTGRIIALDDGDKDLGGFLGRLMARSGEPVIRNAVRQAMRIMGRQFVIGRTIADALEVAAQDGRERYRYSFDMLGEAALTAADAERYLDSYRDAIRSLAVAAAGQALDDAPGISVKLSALHPRYVPAQRDRVLAELTPRLRSLCLAAAEAGIGLTVDAEEAARLDLSLDIMERLIGDSALAGWDGLGLAVQAYQKRAGPVIDWLAEQARGAGRRLRVRLVKGAYWDSEIKLSQVEGLAGYPVFTRKSSTDVSYIACARKLLAAPDAFYPQFATHNAHTVATVAELAGEAGAVSYEFQRLHGMGRILYDQIVGDGGWGVPCRVYAPVGSHSDLLPYLVRRLLENGANTSFVNRLIDDAAPVEQVVADPVARTRALEPIAHPAIPLPADIAAPERKLAPGIDLSDRLALNDLALRMAQAGRDDWHAAPIVAGRARGGHVRSITDPTDRRRTVGTAVDADKPAVEDALSRGRAAQPGWDAIGGAARATILERAAALIEADMAALMAIAVREAGKSIPDAVAEVREAVDYCRYYAARARDGFAQPLALPGPTGETNTLSLHGRGTFACISPWNFPLAIFTGQVTAALAAGNAVVAKPAEQTPLIAARAVRHLHAAGIPADVLHLLPGDGKIGAMLTEDERVAGVAFTGSTEVARLINRTLAARNGPIVPLIAETGGQNAMIVDSSALAEQVVRDVILSAFLSAGQRCSALRVLFVQDDVADRLIRMLAGAMAELAIGDPGLLATDIGPVIDEDAHKALSDHAVRLAREGTPLYRCVLPAECAHGTFFPPQAYEIDRLDRLEREVFGPILHVIRYQPERIDAVIAAINATGYGLTFGMHSRIDGRTGRVAARVRAGNAYINRGMVGAVVGMQPFGGEGLSGTGPKAGGPHYLLRFAVERTRSVDTTAAGGNATLLTMAAEEAP